MCRRSTVEETARRRDLRMPLGDGREHDLRKVNFFDWGRHREFWQESSAAVGRPLAGPHAWPRASPQSRLFTISTMTELARFSVLRL